MEGMVNTDSMRKFYEGKRVFVTGHTGFKGSWLSLWLCHLGAKVFGYALDPPSQPNLFQACAIEGDVDHVHGDIRNIDALCRHMHSVSPDLVFHLAAQPLVRLSYADPRATFETNVLGTVNLLEAVRNSSTCRAVVNVTSDKCYENMEWPWGYRECDRLGGRDPYSASKGCAELVTQSYIHSFFETQDGKTTGVPMVASVRAGNVIGGGDWGEDRIIPDCIRGIDRKTPIAIRYPAAIRPWLHVLEPLNGYLSLAMKLWDEGPAFCGAWNFGPLNTEIWTVEQIVQKVCALWGSGSYHVDATPREHESHWLRLDASKARIRLGWAPKYTVQDALRKAVTWYQLYYQGASAHELKRYSLNQIDDYMNLPSPL
jgi:CDP-glucose 4,6-dehydratase